MTGTPRPLDSIRVVDISNFLAGPLISMFLGDYGAEVVKVENPAPRARRGLVSAADPVLGALTVGSAVPRLAATPPGIDWLGPELGAHNEEIYGGRLGLGAEELAGLRARGIV